MRLALCVFTSDLFVVSEADMLQIQWMNYRAIEYLICE
jgi:hypothetical protein